MVDITDTALHYSDGFTSSSWGQTATTTRIITTKTDDRSALVRTPSGKWRPPTGYSRKIRDGMNIRPTVNVAVDYCTPTDFRRRRMSHAGVIGAPTGYALPSSLSFPSDLSTRATQRALGKLKQQKVNLAVAFGERAATAEHVAQTAARMAKVVRAAVRLKPKTALQEIAKILKVKAKRTFDPRAHPDGKAASLVLEYQYGWKPLYSDIYGSMLELQDRDKRFEDRYHCHVTGKMEDYTDTFVRTRYSSALVSGLLQGDCWMRTRTRNRCYTRLDYVLANPALITASELGLTNPLEMAWELVPFSFVADWFIPIGSYLSRLDAATGWSFKGGSISKITRAHREFGVENVVIASINAIDQKPINGSPISHQKHMQFSRSTFETSPSAWLPNLSGEKRLASGDRAINAIALLTSFFR